MNRFVALFSGLLLVATSLTAAPDPCEFEWRFDGSIGDTLPITLLLRELQNEDGSTRFEGSYFYHRTGLPIELSIEEPEYSQLVCEEISGYDRNGDAQITGVLDLHWNDDRNALSGEWRTPNGKKKLPVHLSESYTDGSVRIQVLTMASSWSESRGSQAAGKSKRVSFIQLPPANSALTSINRQLLKRAWSSEGINIGEDETEAPPANLTVDEVLAHQHVSRPEEIDWDDYPISETSDDRMEVKMNGDGFLTICHNAYGYSGGAHGMYGSGYDVFDLRTGAQISLDQIMKPGSDQRWVALGKKELLKQTGLPPDGDFTETGVMSDFDLTDNWFLVPGGIGFCYNPYEISSYARGQVMFTLPWSDIRDDLLPDSPVQALVAKYGKK